MLASKTVLDGAHVYYSRRPAEFISDWCDTYDPRNAGKRHPDGSAVLARMPFILFPRQVELVQFLQHCIDEQLSGLVEKSRDMGATWLCAAFSVWLWRYRAGASIGWGSRKAMLVDSSGNMDSIFEKIRSIIRGLPPEMRPDGFSDAHMTHMKILNPENGASITGESGDEIGRGGRKLIYFKDESAHYERPEKIEAALADNTNVQIDISSVNGLGNVFHRRREGGVEWYPGIDSSRDRRTQVFIMDWRDHPLKTQEWYDAREKKAEEDGLLHVFRQEVDRNYAASVEGIIIPAEWIESAVDAHLVFPEMERGAWTAALDVADGGADRNALAKRKGVVLRYVDEWGSRDTAVTTRKAVDACEGHGDIDLQYDCIGVGAGVKAEANRLEEENLMPSGVRLVSWNAAAAPQWADERVVEVMVDGTLEDDDESPLNKDFYQNLKAQGWWLLRRRFEKTHAAITEGVRYRADEMISIDSRIPRLRQVQKELSQPTASKSARMKLIVDKTPPGTVSPNVGDAIMMAFHPVEVGDESYDSSLSWVHGEAA